MILYKPDKKKGKLSPFFLGRIKWELLGIIGNNCFVFVKNLN
ncbi:MAG: hypothetical protein RBG13Loki_3216 [Promethearchaeota archaeon CR_4]|nr:MAG: hypothetical protein RBG13Loki_3216 [Candidatus Lokiarchaeota archaeon CR_4]